VSFVRDVFDETPMDADEALQLFSLMDYNLTRLYNSLPEGTLARQVFKHRVNNEAARYALLQNHVIARIYSEIWNSDLRWRAG